ncbi:MAG: acyltransferase [Xanthobacteraceae bacterium]
MTDEKDRFHRRYYFLDGLRGWGAVTVVFFHVMIDGFPANSKMANLNFWSRVFFLNGTFAVSVFFIVSGFSLAIGYLETRDWRILVRLAAGRYLRLVIPIFSVCLIVHLMLRLGIIPAIDARRGPAVFKTMLRFHSTVSHLLDFSLFGVFFGYSENITYVPPLWTMHFEFFGSYLILTVLAVIGNSRLLAFANIALACALVFMGIVYTQFRYPLFLYALFPVGALFAELFLDELVHERRLVLWWITCLLLGLALTLFPRTWQFTVYVLAASLATYGFIFVRRLRMFLENPLSCFLGRISFPLYLVHGPVMWGFSLNFIAYLERVGVGYAAASTLNALIAIPLSFLLAIAFSPINDVAIIVARRFGRSVVMLFDQAIDRFGAGA